MQATPLLMRHPFRSFALSRDARFLHPLRMRCPVILDMRINRPAPYWYTNLTLRRIGQSSNRFQKKMTAGGRDMRQCRREGTLSAMYPQDLNGEGSDCANHAPSTGPCELFQAYLLDKQFA